MRQLIDDLKISVFVAPHTKVAYVPVTKAGSSSLLRVLAQAEGHDVTQYLTAPESVHDRRTYPLPLLGSLDPALQAEILTSPEWLRLTVARDPFKRLYSTWEDKILIGREGWEAFAPPPLVMHRGGIDIGASFRRFVADLGERPALWMSDPHFARQVTLAHPEVIPYSDTVSTTELNALIAHLADRSGRALTSLRANEGLGLDSERFVDDEAAATIIELYRDDFAYAEVEPRRPNRRLKRVVIDPVGTRLHELLSERFRVHAALVWDLRIQGGEAAPGSPMGLG